MASKPRCVSFKCPHCDKAGVYVFESPRDPFAPARAFVVSLTETFSFHSTGTDRQPVIFCDTCRIPVAGKAPPSLLH